MFIFLQVFLIPLLVFSQMAPSVKILHASRSGKRNSSL